MRILDPECINRWKAKPLPEMHLLSGNVPSADNLGGCQKAVTPWVTHLGTQLCRAF